MSILLMFESSFFLLTWWYASATRIYITLNLKSSKVRWCTQSLPRNGQFCWHPLCNNL